MTPTVRSRPVLSMSPNAFRRIAGVAMAAATACTAPQEEVAHDPDAAANVSRPSPFTEITTLVGLPPSSTWPDGTYTFPEITAAGVGIFDFDDDGDLDILQILAPRPGESGPAQNRLFRQEDDGSFLDRTDASGLGDPGYGQGVAIGDVDNDGDLDVYVTNVGRDGFYRNEGAGVFVDATDSAGFDQDAWGTSATFFDYDRDGDLDLYVVHYVQLDSRVCTGPDHREEYCGPDQFEGEVDALFRNNGVGEFESVGRDAGVTLPGRGLGVVAADFTGDDLVDLFVANDGEANHLWVNRGDGTFAEEAITRGLSVNGYGKPEASMGVTAGDVDGDGSLDLFMTHLAGETNTLYTGSDFDLFSDRTDAARMGTVDLPYTGFGCGFFDFDHDGDLDLAIANGRVTRGSVTDHPSEFWGHYAEPNLLLSNRGAGRFDLVEPHGGFGSGSEVSRGLAFGDLDADGDLDLVVADLGGLRVFRNDATLPGSHWLMVHPETGGRDATGAQITLTVEGRKLVRIAQPGYSYASSNDPRVHFGLGSATQVESMEVLWADGSREAFGVPFVDRVVRIRQGDGVAL
jgi:enediyne biosynthesis protein E4